MSYRDAGYAFPDHYFEGEEAYSQRRPSLYSDEPIFLAAMRLAEQLRAEGKWSDVQMIVEISAEHRGIAQAKAQGLTPTGSSIIVHNF